LFSESAARALVSVLPGREAEFAALAAEHGVPAAVLGTVSGAGDGAALTITDVLSITLSDLRAAWTAPLPALFD
jgi:phosphoribosylformylglycinamidine synthase